MKRYIKTILESLFDDSEDIIDGNVEIDFGKRLINAQINKLKRKIINHKALSKNELGLLYSDESIKIPVKNVDELVTVMVGLALAGGDNRYNFRCIDVSALTSLAYFSTKLEDECTGELDFHELTANMDLSGWDVSNVTDMSHTFEYSYVRSNCGIQDWDVSNVKKMDYMFRCISYFDGNLNNWDVSNVESMTGMFEDCILLDVNIEDWDVSNVKNMDYMFAGCELMCCFNPDFNKWDISNVKSMRSIFKGADINLCSIEAWGKLSSQQKFHMGLK